jgi:hypothetical protein
MKYIAMEEPKYHYEGAEESDLFYGKFYSKLTGTLSKIK